MRSDAPAPYELDNPDQDQLWRDSIKIAFEGQDKPMIETLYLTIEKYTDPLPGSHPGRRVSKTPISRGRRSSEHAAETRERILSAGLDAFSELGFGAASLREIGGRAEVNQQLITHHFGSKLGLWRAVADHIFGLLTESIADRLRGLEGIDISERVRMLPREFLGFCAEHPEFVRLMMHEGATPGPRLEWIAERHVRPLFDWLAESVKDAQTEELTLAGDPIHIAYLVIGATTIFAHSALFELVTGRSPRDQEVIDEHARLVLAMVFPGALDQSSHA